MVHDGKDIKLDFLKKIPSSGYFFEKLPDVRYLIQGIAIVILAL